MSAAVITVTVPPFEIKAEGDTFQIGADITKGALIPALDTVAGTMLPAELTRLIAGALITIGATGIAVLGPLAGLTLLRQVVDSFDGIPAAELREIASRTVEVVAADQGAGT